MTRVLEWMYTGPFRKASWEDKEEVVCSMQKSGLNAWSFALKWVTTVESSWVRHRGQINVDDVMVGACYVLPDEVEEVDGAFSRGKPHDLVIHGALALP